MSGVISSVRLRLARRTKLRRVVEITDLAGLGDRFANRIAAGFTYGDFQYVTDTTSPHLLRRGVFSCYRPVPDDTPIPQTQQQLSSQDWMDLLADAHTAPTRAFRSYASYYMRTSGQLYWSDTHQLSTYTDDDQVPSSRRTPPDARVPGPQAQARPRRTLPERLVPPAAHPLLEE